MLGTAEMGRAGPIHGLALEPHVQLLWTGMAQKSKRVVRISDILNKIQLGDHNFPKEKPSVLWSEPGLFT